MAWNNTNSEWVTLIVDPISKELQGVYSTMDSQPKSSKKEEYKEYKHYDDYNLPCGCHEEPDMFSLHVDCKLPEHLNYNL